MRTPWLRTPPLRPVGPTEKSRRRAPRFALVLEHLEDRSLPSATLTIDASNHLSYTGSGDVANVLSITRVGGNYTFSDSAEPITIVNSSATIQFSGSGTNTVMQTSGLVQSLTAKGGFENGSFLTVGTGGIATTGGVQLTGWDVLVVNNSIATTGPNQPIILSANGGVTNTLTVAGGTALSTAGGAVTITALNVTHLGSNITTGGGSIVVNFPVNLTHDVVADAGAGNATFWGAINGAKHFTVNSGGTTTFGSILGGTTPLASLTTDAAGSTLVPSAAISTTGPLNLNDTLTLGTNPQITASNATFAKAVGGGGGSFSVTGDASFLGAVSGFTSLAVSGDAVFGTAPPGLTSLFVAGHTNLNVPNLTTTGTQHYAGGLTLGSDVSLTGSTITVGGNLTGSSKALAVNGNAVINSAATGLTTLSVSGATTLNGGSATSSGAQTYGGTLTLGANTTLTATNVSLSTIVGNSRSLAIAGTGTFGGSASGLSSLSVSGATTLGAASVTSTGAQSFGGTVSLLNDVTLTATLVTFSTTVAGGSNDLSVNGSVVLSGNVSVVQSLTVSGAATINASQVSAASQTYSGAVSLGSHATLTGTNASFTGTINGAGFDLTLTFSGTCTVDVTSFSGVRHLTVGPGGTTALDGTISTSGNQSFGSPLSLLGSVILTGPNLTFGATVSGAGNGLTINGNSFVNGTLSGISNLAISGSTTLNVSSVTTTGTQSYSGGLSLNANTTLSGGTVTLGAVAGGSHSLSVNGNTFVNGPLNGLTSLSVVGTTLLTSGNVSTSGFQSYSGIVTILAHTTLTGTTVTFGSTVASGGLDLTLTFSGTTIVNGSNFIGIRHLTLSAGGSTQLSGTLSTTGNQNYQSPITLAGDVNLVGTTITLANTLSGFNNDLAITGSAHFQSTINNLASLTVNGATQFDIPSVSTSGAQSYLGAVSLTSDTTLTASTITLGGVVTGAGHDLSLAGNTFLNGVDGIGSLSISGSTTVTGSTINTTGAQTYNGIVALSSDTTLSGQMVTFGAAIIGNAHDLTLVFSGTTTINGATVSGIDDLTTGPGGATLLSGALTTTGVQTFQNQVILTAFTHLTAAEVVLNQAMAIGNTSLQITGDAVLNQNIGGLVNLAVSGVTTIKAASIVTTGNQTYTGPVNLTNNVTLTGAVVGLFAGVNGANSDLHVVGNAAFGGSATGLDSLSISGATSLNAAAIHTTGPQTYGGPVSLGADATLDASSADINLADSVNGSFTLTISAANDVTIVGPVGDVNPLVGLTFNAAGAVELNGAVILGFDPLSVGGTSNNIAFKGVISGPGDFVLIGPGAVTLTAENVYTGTTLVQAGTIRINGNQPSSAITLAGGKLAGTGTTGAVDATGGTVAPGDEGSGILHTADLTLGADATYSVRISGIGIPGQPNLVSTVGSIALNNAKLLVDVVFEPKVSDVLAVLRNDGADAIVGTFAGLPEGGLIKSNQRWFQISYVGGDGNDVVLRRYTATYFVIAGTGHVEVRDIGDGSVLYVFEPYGAGYTKGISVAVGDVNGDGFSDVVTGALVGNPHVKVFDGQAIADGAFNEEDPNTELLASWFPYALQFNVGANVAAGDVNGDGFADVVTGASAGNPDVRVYNGKDIALDDFKPNGASLLAKWFPYALQFNVGANVAVDDVNNDGFADISTGATAGNPDVRLYNGRDIATNTFKPNGKSLLAKFFAYGLNFNVGAYVAIGDTNGDGYGDIITGSSVGNPEVHVYDGKAIADKTFNNAKPQDSLLNKFFAFELGNNIGVSVASADFEGEGKSAILTGAEGSAVVPGVSRQRGRANTAGSVGRNFNDN